MKLEKNQYYTLEKTQDVLQAVIHKNALVLKDLKASYKWQHPKTSGEYFEGYRIKGQTLVPIQFYRGNGRTGECMEHREAISLAKLLECRREETVIDLEE